MSFVNYCNNDKIDWYLNIANGVWQLNKNHNNKKCLPWFSRFRFVNRNHSYSYIFWLLFFSHNLTMSPCRPQCYVNYNGCLETEKRSIIQKIEGLFINRIEDRTSLDKIKKKIVYFTLFDDYFIHSLMYIIHIPFPFLIVSIDL